jgi:acetyltransferase-like isoleucine patch superfamily enzyme
MTQYFKAKERIYFMPGAIISVLLQLAPSFRLRCGLLNIFGRRCRIHSSVTLHNRLRILIPRDIEIGQGSTVNGSCLIDSRYPVKIGCRTMLGHGTTIFTLGHDIDHPKFASKGGPVIIGDHAIIFPLSIIMPGVTIGAGAVVMTGSVVTHDVEPMHVIGGVPATFIRLRERVSDHDFDYRSYFAL